MRSFFKSYGVVAGIFAPGFFAWALVASALGGLAGLPLSGAGPALAMEATAVAAPMAPTDSARQGVRAWRAGNAGEALERWTKAAEAGHEASQWRLARMYAEGKGVPRDDKKAVYWYRQIVEGSADEDPGAPQAGMTSKAFVALGSYYLAGVPGTEISKDPVQAWRMYYHAASVLGDADAQYRLGRLYLDGEGVEKNVQLAQNWLKSAAQKGHYLAQALLGKSFCEGEKMPRRGVEGLMWLSLARNQVRAPQDSWIVTAFEDAYTMASDEERAHAAQLVRRWQRQGRE